MTINNDIKNNDEYTQNSATTTLESMDLKQIKLRETCAAGEGWMAEVKKNQTLRIIDTKGNQAVDTLLNVIVPRIPWHKIKSCFWRWAVSYSLIEGKLLPLSQMTLVVVMIRWAVHAHVRATPCVTLMILIPCIAAETTLCIP